MSLLTSFAMSMVLSGLTLVASPALAQTDHLAQPDHDDLRLLNVASVRSGLSLSPILSWMEHAYLRTRQFPEGSIEWQAASADYEQLRRDFDRERARGATVFADVPKSVAAYVLTFSRWWDAPPGSAQQSWLQSEFRTYRDDAEALARRAEEPTPIADLFELSVSQFTRYLDAAKPSADETTALVAYELLRRAYFTKLAGGQRLFANARAAGDAARRLEQDMAGLPSGSTQRKVAAMRLDAAQREAGGPDPAQ